MSGTPSALGTPAFEADLLERVFELAAEALAQGERPVGALLATDGRIVAEATDAVFAQSDPTAHAERVVIAKHCKAQGRVQLRGHTLYSFIEPCLMCCGAIHWAKLDRVVFALSQTQLQRLSGGRPKPGIRSYLPAGGAPITIVGPLDEARAYELAGRYAWRGRRV